MRRDLGLTALEELATGLHWNERDTILMLWAQMDETGIHDKRSGRYKHLAIGGAIAEFSDWQARWRNSGALRSKTRA